MVSSRDASPLQAAVRQAIARGEESKARVFVSERAKLHADAEQRALQALVAPGRKTDEQSRVLAGVGRIVGGTHFMEDTISYFYCGSSGCTLVGKVDVDYRTVLNFYPTITLDGEWSVRQGPSVDFTAAECVARYDRNGAPDTTVFTWSNCPNAHNAHTWTTRALIQAQNWRQGGTRGASYFNRYRLTFKTSAGNQPSFGPYEWDTHRWKISSSGSSASWVP